MSKRKWIIGALLLLLPGLVGLILYSAHKRSWEETFRLASEASAHNQVSKDYLQMYEQWSNLSAEEKSENPWGQGQYGGPEIQKKLMEGQSDRFWADLPDLEKNISHFPQELAEVMYGQDWHQKLSDYQNSRSMNELILIGSTFLLACGSIVSAGLILRGLISVWLRKSQESAQTEELSNENPEPAAPTPALCPEALSEESPAAEAAETTGEEASQEPHIKRKRTNGGEGYFQSRIKDGQSTPAPKPGAEEAEKPSFMQHLSSLAGVSPEPARTDSYFGWAVELEEKPELKTLMTTEPLTKELSELTEEVSAIRHFAAQQQDQMRKLQDGYDWMIVRRFCMRIIRCVDNIEDRIARLTPKEQVLSDHLQDIRDELIFALESSGVEQYEPDLNISYKGLERYAEAIKERVYTGDDAKAGFIAEVVRKGYQYLVNDEDVKIVRCAQVKLYDVTQSE
jgi:molecular chaperone GrpE (heat shock protein)